MSDDRLADLLIDHVYDRDGSFEHEWACSCGAQDGASEHEHHQADALRAALADGSLPLSAVVPPEVVAVIDAAVAWGERRPYAYDMHGLAMANAALADAVDALPEHLRGEA